MGFNGYLATVIITALVCVGVTAVIVWQIVLLIMRQRKLYHSIQLVELKPSKVIYWVFAFIVGLFIIYILLQIADGGSASMRAFAELFGVGRKHANTVFLFVLLAMTATEAFIIGLAVSRSAVVDKGVYTNFGMLDWHQVRDYIVDEKKGMLILTSDRDTFSTLRNITTPFRISKGDVEKLKFILNKNKNKFSGFDGN